MEDNVVYFDKDTPKIEQANKVKSLLAVNGEDDTIGSVEFDLLVIEASKHVGDTVKIDGLVLPTLGEGNKRATVRGGSTGKTFTYGSTTIEVGANMVADLFWDGTAGEWSKVEEVEMPMAEGVDVIDPNGDRMPTEKAVADYVSDKTVQLVVGKNMFNPSGVVENKYINNSGLIMTSAGWAISGLIDISHVPDGKELTLSSDKTRAGIGFYDSNEDVVRYLHENTGTYIKESGEHYIAFNIKSPAEPDWTWVQLEVAPVASAYEPYGKYIPQEKVAGLQEVSAAALATIDFTENIDITKLTGSTNILDPRKVFKAGFLNPSDGSILTGTGVTDMYQVSDFIPASSQGIFEILNEFGGIYGARNLVYYSETKSRLGSLDFPDSLGTSIILPANSNIRYVRFSLIGENHDFAPGQYYPERMGIFRGEGNSFEPFYEGATVFSMNNDAPTSLKGLDGIATIRDVQTLLQDDISPLSYVLDENGDMNLTNNVGRISMSTRPNLGYTRNDVVNFMSYNIKGVTANNTDDVAPIHAMNTTIGANHGGPSWIATINAHGLHNEDIGKVFTQDAKMFVLARIVDENKVQFISENTGTPSNPTFDGLSVGVVSNEGNIYTVASRVSQQLYQAVKDVSIRILADGKEVVVGSGTAKKLEIMESYEIKSVPSIVETLKARVGSSDEPDFDGDGFIKIENIYRFDERLNCLVFVRTRQLAPMVFADIMATQAIILGGTNNGTTQYYIPNSNPLNGTVDLRKPTAYTWSSGVPSTFVINESQPEPNNPPNRVIQYKGDVGFMVGYLPNKGVSKDLASYTARTFEIRNNTGKIYPHAVESSKVGEYPDVDTVFNIAMYRAFTDLTKTRRGNRLSLFEVKDGDTLFVFLDYSASMFDDVVLSTNLNGKSVEVVENRNAELLSDIYNNGISVKAHYVEGETCYIVLKIK